MKKQNKIVHGEDPVILNPFKLLASLMLSITVTTFFTGCNQDNQEPKGVPMLKMEMTEIQWIRNLQQIQEEWKLVQKDFFSIRENLVNFQDFSPLRERTDKILKSIQDMRQIHESDKRKHGEQHPELFLLSEEYINSLATIIQQLSYIQNELYKKSRSSDANYYKWKTYSNDIDKYSDLIEIYSELGSKMNLKFIEILTKDTDK